MASDSPAAEPRRIVRIGKYEILKHVATGGMGAVYRARDTEDGREVALKVLTPDVAAKPAMLIRFKREAEHAKKLTHENIVSIHDFGESEGTWYIAMEFVEGIDLHEYIVRKKGLDPEESRQLIIQAAHALDHAHSHNLVHRDIKPSNFLLTRQNGRIVLKLTDMGLAREVSGEEFRVTRAGTTVGTVDYIAPEQARDSGAADIRSDLYSLGCTWFHMLTGRAPFPEGGLAERLCKHMMDDPPDVRSFNPRISKNLKAILDKLLAKKPEGRYQTPAELLEALESLRAVSQPGIKPDTVPDEDLDSPSASDSSRCDTVADDHVTPARPETVKRYVGTRRLAPGVDAKQQPDIKKKVDAPGSKAKLYYMIGGGAGLAVLLGLVALFAFSSGSGTPKPKPRDEQVAVVPPSPPPIVIPDKEKDPGPKDPINPTIRTDPPKKEYPALYKPASALNADKLRAEVDEPWTKAKPLPADLPVLVVSRLPVTSTASTFASLTDACKAAPSTGAIVEIQDNGPIYELGGAAPTTKHLHIRAAKGYRPLVVWDVQKVIDDLRREKGASLKKDYTFLGVQKGHLSLQGVEFAFRWPDAVEPASLTVFRIAEGDLAIRSCSFSVIDAGKRGVTLARLTGQKNESQADATRCRLSGCFARGTTLTALDLESPGSEVLVEDCLLVGGDPTLLKVKTMDRPGTNLRIVRSTLICNKNLLHLQSLAATEPKVGFQFLGWDSVLSRSSIEEGGDLVSLGGENLNLTGMGWRAINCLYTGWQNLLNGKGKGQVIAFTEPSEWQRLWGRSEGDVARRDTWPGQPFADLHDKPARNFSTAENKTVAYASSQSTTKSLGCDLDNLPLTRDNWLALTLERYDAPLIEPLTDPGPPTVQLEGELFYGQKIELTAVKKIDVTQVLEEKKKSLAKKVVLHLVGTGEHWISPIKIKPGTSLIIYVEPPKEPIIDMSKLPKGAPLPMMEKPPPIVLKMSRNDKRPETDALIDVEGGSLEIYNADIRLFDDAHAVDLPHRMIRARGGDVKLFRTKLIGPQVHTPRGYVGLIDMAGSADTSPAKAHLCQVTESILLSCQKGLELQGIGLRLALQQSLLATGGDAITFDPGEAYQSKANTQFILERSTIASQHAALVLKQGPKAELPLEPFFLQSNACAFLSPFAPASPTNKPGLLRVEGPALAQGLLIWQSDNDLLDHRMQFLAASDQALPAQPQPGASWQRLWGFARVTKPILDWSLGKPVPRDGIGPQDAKVWPLDRLALPGPRPNMIDKRAGADLELLGILKKPPRKL